MTNDLQQARIEAAAKVLLRDYQSEYDGGEVSEFLDVARAALAAADAHLPTVEQIAEVLQAHRYIPVVNGPEKCSCGESFRDRWAHEVHQAVLLRGEVAGDE